MYLLSWAVNLTTRVHEFKAQRSRLKEVTIFSVFGLLVPVLLSVIVAIIEPQYGEVFNQLAYGQGTIVVTAAQRSLILASVLTTFLSALAGLVLQAVIGFTKLLASGHLFFYLYFIIPGILSLFGVSSLVGFWVSNALNALLLVVMVVVLPSIRKSFWLLFKPSSLLFILFATIVIYGATFGLGVAGSAIFPTDSDNQGSLNRLSFVQLFISAVLIAPFVEEFIVRRTIMTTFGGNILVRVTGTVLACVFFAFLHIRTTNDWQHILTYFLPSIALTAGTYFLRNALPSAGGHMLSNLTTLLVNYHG